MPPNTIERTTYRLMVNASIVGTFNEVRRAITEAKIMSNVRGEPIEIVKVTETFQPFATISPAVTLPDAPDA